MQIETSPLSALLSFEDNPRRISSEALLRLKTSIRTLGLFKPLLGWRASPNAPLVVIGGNQRLRAIREMVAAGEIPEAPVPVVVFGGDEVAARTIALRDNATEGEWDDVALAEFLVDLEALAATTGTAFEGDLTGFDAKTLDALSVLAERREAAFATLFPDTEASTDATGQGLDCDFPVPPTSVLEQTSRDWKSRRALWMALFDSSRGRSRSEKTTADVGRRARGGLALPDPAARDSSYYDQKAEAERALGRRLSRQEFEQFHYRPPANATLTRLGTSVFDPVLAEAVYRWWGNHNDAVLDPFAGGSVRGIVAAALGLRYTGVDLRAEQVAENREQWAHVEAGLATGIPAPRWVVGDSSDLGELLPAGEQYDLVFSCPPYHDLEVYSDDERDLSNLSWADFRMVYRAIIRAATSRLRAGGRAVFVVGEVRGPKGFYRNLVGETVGAFLDAGLSLLDEAILRSPGGALRLGLANQFAPYRKLGKCHQNVLAFLKPE